MDTEPLLPGLFLVLGLADRGPHMGGRGPGYVMLTLARYGYYLTSAGLPLYREGWRIGCSINWYSARDKLASP
jgi:hypothetical protein